MSEKSITTFGARLRSLREGAGLTQEELAARAGMTAKGIGALERGQRERPYPYTVRSLADALGLTGAERETFVGAVPRRTGMAFSPTTELKGSALPPLPVPPTPLVGRERSGRSAARARGAAAHADGAGGRRQDAPRPGSGRCVAGCFHDGVVFVDLTEVDDPARFVPTLVRALGLQMAGSETLFDHLLDHLREKEMLLVLDNFEQVVSASLLLVRLLSACPHLKALVTSRVALAARGEQRFNVAPLESPALPGPDSASIEGFPAVALFVGRAMAVDPAFRLTDANAEAVAGICRRLDGLPLAIELAASRTNLLPPEALLARLTSGLGLLESGAPDAPERQRTMHAAISWSYELLHAEKRTLLRRLSVFEGGCTIEAAEAVCAGPEERLDVFGGLSALVDASLLGRRTEPNGEPRLTMLMVIREFARELLAGAGEGDEARERHARYFLNLAETAEPALYEPDHPAWLDRIEREHDNLRAALGWVREVGEVEIGLRLAGSLRWFWWVRGHLREGRDWLRTFLDLDAAHGSELARGRVRAKALYGAGQLAFGQGDLPQAARLYEGSLAAYRRLGDERGTAQVVVELGQVARAQEDLDRAAALSEEGLALSRQTGYRVGAAIALIILGHVQRERGDLEGAMARYEESLGYIEQSEHRRGVAYGLSSLGGAALESGEIERALSLYEESLSLYDELADKAGVATALVGLGDVARERGDEEWAAALYNDALSLHRELGNSRGVARALARL